jgi:Tfp pilus assembly ATPase PilU
MQDFDAVIRDLIEQKVISLEDGLSYATNQNNLLLQLKGLSSTEDYVNKTGKAIVEPLAPPPPAPANSNSVLDLIE